MSLLDGKYEVFRQQQADPVRTVFEATAPDGTRLRIEWFELTPDQEEGFERYRRTVKRLKRTGRTAVYDVTSRPGARYVAWERPPDASSRGRDPELEELLRAEGFEPENALMLRDQGETRLFGLAFGGMARPLRPEAPPASASQPRPSWWSRLPERARAWSLAVMLLAFALALTAIGFDRRTTDRIVVVPDWTGRPVNEVAAELHQRGFGVDVVPSSSGAEAGQVLALDPAPGTSLRPGRVVRVTYALPAGQLPPREVPRLVGETFPDAVTARLEREGLELGRVARIAADVPRDAVLAQSVAAGTAIGQGEPVHILVSDGPRPEATFLPDLVGLDVEDAQWLASLAGLPADRIFVERVPSSGEAGRVLSQSLAPHRVVAQDEAVLRLIVGRGGATAAEADATPSYVGMERSEALRASGAAAADVELIEVPALPEGVVDQDPAPGAPPADRIRLVVNVHPLPIPVPEPRAEVRTREPREVPFAWTIEPGIPEVIATVYASTLEGESRLVHSQRVSGGERVEGTWLTRYPGVVTFRLELNGQPYSTRLRVP